MAINFFRKYPKNIYELATLEYNNAHIEAGKKEAEMLRLFEGKITQENPVKQEETIYD